MRRGEDTSNGVVPPRLAMSGLLSNAYTGSLLHSVPDAIAVTSLLNFLGPQFLHWWDSVSVCLEA